MNSITQDVHQINAVSQKMQNFFATYRIGQILRKANACKLTGVPALQIVFFVFAMAFSNKSMYMEMKLHPEESPFGKDTFYRFMKSCHTSWRKIILNITYLPAFTIYTIFFHLIFLLSYSLSLWISYLHQHSSFRKICVFQDKGIYTYS